MAQISQPIDLITKTADTLHRLTYIARRSAAQIDWLWGFQLFCLRGG